MGFFIADIFRRSSLKKFRSQKETGLRPLDSIRSAVVVIDAGEPECKLYGERILDFFKKRGIGVSFVFIDLRRKKKGMTFHYSGENLISRKDVNWFGMPKKKVFGKLFPADFDLLVDLRDSEDFTEKFISVCTAAAFKIGSSNFRGNRYDLVFPSGSGQERTTDERIDVILGFFDKISKPFTNSSR